MVYKPVTLNRSKAYSHSFWAFTFCAQQMYKNEKCVGTGPACPCFGHPLCCGLISYRRSSKVEQVLLFTVPGSLCGVKVA